MVLKSEAILYFFYFFQIHAACTMVNLEIFCKNIIYAEISYLSLQKKKIHKKNVIMFKKELFLRPIFSSISYVMKRTHHS